MLKGLFIARVKTLIGFLSEFLGYFVCAFDRFSCSCLYAGFPLDSSRGLFLKTWRGGGIFLEMLVMDFVCFCMCRFFG